MTCGAATELARTSARVNSLSAPPHCPSISEVGAGKVQTGDVILNFFPADEDTSESIERSVVWLHHPTSCLLDSSPPPGFRFIMA